ncbi:MAG: 5-formyltetrahydrofolate cyclo-ligase [Alphaproteobacteria bacterium]|nr:5-formyltetrahydrofolate cyclo-ligase [Alphaproteobacteria bacterium]
MTSAKREIRQFAREQRDQMDIDPSWSEEAASIFMGAVKPSANQIVSLYFPMGNELDTLPLAEELWKSGIKTALPIIQGKAQPLLFAEWSKSTKLQSSTFGTQEPAEPNFIAPDILVVPLLAFDQVGNRMGLGQGHFDATLKSLRAEKNILAVGYAYSTQAVLLALPTEPHDEKLDMVITEQRVFDFRP